LLGRCRNINRFVNRFLLLDSLSSGLFDRYYFLVTSVFFLGLCSSLLLGWLLVLGV